MNTSSNLFISFTFMIYALSDCSAPRERLIKPVGPEVISFRTLPFNTGDIKLLDGPFFRAAEYFWHTVVEHHSSVNGGKTELEKKLIK
jgi:hypothetical protein